MPKRKKPKRTPEEIFEQAIEEFAHTMLIAFKADDRPLDAHTLVEEAVAAYFEAMPEEKRLVEGWAERGGSYREWRNEVWIGDRLFSMIEFAREEMGLIWLTTRTRFAYDYSSFKPPTDP